MSNFIISVQTRLALRSDAGNVLTDYLATALVVVGAMLALFTLAHGGSFNGAMGDFIQKAIGKASDLIASDN